MKQIDARGLACPAPVLQARAAVENECAAEVQVVVDNDPARQNVQRFLESKGFQTTVQPSGADFVVIGRAGSAAAPQPAAVAPEAHKKVMVLCATDRLGYGDDALGLKLMVNFIKTLKEMGPELWRLVFVNNGVKLTIGGSAVLTELQAYQKEGLEILVCGTCLEHFNLLDQKQVGETTNMLDIVTAMQLADKVITI
jgi:selenium metabolism protein YedF